MSFVLRLNINAILRNVGNQTVTSTIFGVSIYTILAKSISTNSTHQRVIELINTKKKTIDRYQTQWRR